MRRREISRMKRRSWFWACRKRKRLFRESSGYLNDKDEEFQSFLHSLNERYIDTEGFLRSVQGKLKNERFVNNAPAVVVDKEKQKLADGEEKIKIIEDQIRNLSDN